MKRFLFVALVITGSNAAIAKQVDVHSAQVVAANFLGNTSDAGVSRDVKLVYTAHAGSTNYYYVFNNGTKGFVIVTADDRVKPVIAYSTETGFDVNNIPSNATGLLDNYKEQIAYAIDNNLTPTQNVVAKWNALLMQHIAARTTGTATIAPLLATTWNQDPYYNGMCPVAGNNEQTVAGCVATATAQVMKYWNYPATGNGTHSYSTAYGVLSADFGATTYNWDAMPATVSSNNTAVATLIYQVGVSVDMTYNTASNGGSGSYVTKSFSPVTNCAEYALTTYFRYASTTHGIERGSFSSDQEWIDTLKNEIANLRPVIYAGFGSVGGHCWVADGFDANDMMHINWGWGGVSNGYFDVSAMNPPALGAGGGSGGFNYGQHAIIGIQPDNMATPDPYEVNNTVATAYQFTPSLNSGSTRIMTTGSNLHVTNDQDYYYIILPAGDNYIVHARLQDKTSSNDGNTYSLDAKFATSRNPSVVWSAYLDSVMTDQPVNGGGVMYFRVLPVVAGDMGTYLLDITVDRQATGIKDAENNAADIAVYPNPANNEVNIALDNRKADIKLTDLQGRTIQGIVAEGRSTVKLQTSALNSGLYFVHINLGDHTVTQKISVVH